jgi:uncharacterized protein DUF3768
LHPSRLGRIERVRRLNDVLRRYHLGGQVVVSAGVHALDSDVVARIAAAVARFDAFTPDNDPYGEHDFGSVCVEGHTVLFKIEYLDTSLRHHSPDPADPNVTHRVMILMPAEEY